MSRQRFLRGLMVVPLVAWSWACTGSLGELVYGEPLATTSVTSGRPLELSVTASGKPLEVWLRYDVSPSGERFTVTGTLVAATKAAPKQPLDIALGTDDRLPDQDGGRVAGTVRLGTLTQLKPGERVRFRGTLRVQHAEVHDLDLLVTE